MRRVFFGVFLAALAGCNSTPGKTPDQVVAEYRAETARIQQEQKARSARLQETLLAEEQATEKEYQERVAIWRKGILDQFPEGKPYTLTSGERSETERVVASYLKDPTSALFDLIRAGKAANGLVTVCGTVNGRNSYGAYAGGQAFVANISPSGQAFLFWLVKKEEESVASIAICEKTGALPRL